MLVLPMRSQDSSPNRPDHDSCTHHPLPARHQEPSPQTEQLRKQVTGTILSMIPTSTPPAPKRPKLSLQTSIPQLLPRGPTLNPSATDSPTTRNTKANAFEPPPPTPSSAIQPQVTFPSSVAPTSSTTSSSTASSDQSPFSSNPPYILPIGTHSILRNSPLPRRHISAASARPPRRMFPPIKRVAFRDSKLTETIPHPAIEASPPDGEEEVENVPATEEEQWRRREEIQAEDGHATPMHSRRKRRREWIWRPLDDDVLMGHGPSQDTEGSRNEARSPTAIPLPGSAVEANDANTGLSGSLPVERWSRAPE